MAKSQGPEGRVNAGYTVGKGKPPAHTRFKKANQATLKAQDLKFPNWMYY
jgi:hypothetical protein